MNLSSVFEDWASLRKHTAYFSIFQAFCFLTVHNMTIDVIQKGLKGFFYLNFKCV